MIDQPDMESVDDELHLAQNPSTISNSVIRTPSLQRSLTAPGLNINVLAQRRQPLVANDNLLDSDSEESSVSPTAPQQTTEPFLRRSITNNSGVIESSNSTVSFRNTANVVTNNNANTANSINPFGAGGRRSNQSTSFFSSIGQRGLPMSPLEPGFLQNPFAR